MEQDNNPDPPGCCCLPLREGIAVMALIDLVLGVTGACVLVIFLFGVISLFFSPKSSEAMAEFSLLMTVLLVTILIILLIHIFFSYSLYIGAKNRDLGRCRRWFVVMLIFWTLGLIGLVFAGLKGDFDDGPLIFLGGVTVLFYRFFMLLAVRAFMKDLEMMGRVWALPPQLPRERPCPRPTSGRVVAIPIPLTQVVITKNPVTGSETVLISERAAEAPRFIYDPNYNLPPQEDNNPSRTPGHLSSSVGTDTESDDLLIGPPPPTYEEVQAQKKKMNVNKREDDDDSGSGP